MKKVIRLDNIQAIPPKLKEKLAKQKRLLSRNEAMDSLIRESPLAEIANELDEYVKGNLFVGYHCTKEIEKGFIKKHGLRITDIKSHQQEFLQNHKDKFSAEERTIMTDSYESYFKSEQLYGRNSKIWFCLSPQLVLSSGTKYFFNYFGGEAIYWTVMKYESITRKLSEMGFPVVVEARLDPRNFVINRMYEFSLEMLGHYHKSVNPKTDICLGEGYSRVDIKSEEIIKVYDRDEFFKLHRRN